MTDAQIKSISEALHGDFDLSRLGETLARLSRAGFAIVPYKPTEHMLLQGPGDPYMDSDVWYEMVSAFNAVE